MGHEHCKHMADMAPSTAVSKLAIGHSNSKAPCLHGTCGQISNLSSANIGSDHRPLKIMQCVSAEIVSPDAAYFGATSVNPKAPPPRIDRIDPLSGSLRI